MDWEKSGKPLVFKQAAANLTVAANKLLGR